jgi:uncharacterized protein (TIGR02246 family)
MRFPPIALYLILAASAPAWGAEPPADPAAAERAEVAPLLAAMGAAANAHDVERHVGFYAHDPSVTLIFNGQAIVGWDAIRDKQAEWWKNGKTDVVYTMQGPPEIRVAGPGLVITTLYMKSKRTLPNGEIGESSFAASALWQKRAEGWRVIYAHESTAH